MGISSSLSLGFTGKYSILYTIVLGSEGVSLLRMLASLIHLDLEEFYLNSLSSQSSGEPSRSAGGVGTHLPSEFGQYLGMTMQICNSA